MDGSNLCEDDFYQDGSRKLDCNRICNYAFKSGDLETEFNSNCRDLCSACWEKIVKAWKPSVTTTTVASQDSTFGPTSVTPATTGGSPDSFEMLAHVMKDIVLPALAASAALGLVLFGAYKVYQHFRKGQCSQYVDVEAAKALLIKAKNEKVNTPTGDTLSITMKGTNNSVIYQQQVIPRPDAPRSPSPPPSPSVSEKQEEDEENIGPFPAVPEDSAEPTVPQDATSSETEHAQPEDAAQATPEAAKEFQEVTDDEKPPHDVIPDNEDPLA